MPKFQVTICKISYSTIDIEVDAATESNAEELALAEAGDHVFSEDNADYEV